MNEINNNEEVGRGDRVVVDAAETYGTVIKAFRNFQGVRFFEVKTDNGLRIHGQAGRFPAA